MNRSIPALLLFVSAVALLAQAQITISPTTTLTAQTASNTSAWSGYTKDASDNPAAGNVSKIKFQTLLNDPTITIGARLIPFWGTSYHPDVGYSENSYTQVQKQVNDAMSRGVNYFVIDWYGPPNTPDQTFNNTSALNLKKAAEATGGNFRFALSLDKGALRYCAQTSGCSMTNTVIQYINYILANYATSSAYQKTGDGVPWIWTFDPDLASSTKTIDWSYVRSHLSRSVKLLFRNDIGFKHAQADGAFAWTCTDDPLSCITGFYWQYTHYYASKIAVGSAYNGFNDQLAAWSTDKRFQPQQCGTLWLSTWDLVNTYPYFSSTGHYLHHVQIGSWNDYEEGHEIETGVDNCVNLSTSLSSSTLSWGIGSATNYYTGEPLDLQSTIDHFRIWVSSDGENLMKLTDLTAAARSLDLAQYKFSSPVYLYVQAVGKPAIQNNMSPVVGYPAGTPKDISTYAVNISSPSSDASVGSPVHVSAAANFSAAQTEVWVDYSTKAYAVSGAKVDTYLSLSSGSHRITVASYTTGGTKYSSSVTVTVADKSVTISSPENNTTSGSPVHVAAQANFTAARTEVWVDYSTKMYAVSGGTVDTYLKLGSGTHRITIASYTSSGTKYTDSATVTVSTSRSISLTSPVAGQTLASPVTVKGSASGPYTVTAMQVYVDDKLAYTVNNTSLVNTQISMSKGTHAVVLKAWDETGASWATASTTIYVN